MMKILIFLTLTIISNASFAKLNVVTTTPDLAWLIQEIGQDRVQVYSLLEGSEDPHYVDAMPNWISKVSNADVFCFVGMDLEVGWAPKVLAKSGNAKVQPGGKGHCDAGKSVTALEVPKENVDRSMGDVHGGGNPHYHLGPTYFIQAADGITSILLEVDPSGAQIYLNNLETLKQKIKRIKEKVSSLLKVKKDLKMISYHREFSYFFKDFNLKSAGEIEETPGVPPSAGRIARIALKAKKENIGLVLATTSNPKKLLDKFKEISHTPIAIIPLSILKSGKPSTYEELLIGLAKAILTNAKK